MNKFHLIGIIVIIALVILFIESKKTNVEDFIETDQEFMPIKEKELIYPRYEEISNPSGFINSDNFTLSEYIGKKVIIVDFWTYSCINCQRTLPYLEEWHSKYKDQGLFIVGIHTPEFKFEEDYTNVQEAVSKFGVDYPVVLDNSYATWQAYENRYWPRKYLIDIDGYIVYDHIGEGAYEETELKIQQLLEERKNRLKLDDSISKQISQPNDPYSVDFTQVKSPEIYFGSQRNEYLGNGVKGKKGVQNFEEPAIISPNILYLSGSWDIQDEYAESLSESKIIFKYDSKNVYMVASAKDNLVASVSLDNEFVRDLSIKEEQLYSIIEGNSYSQNTLEIEVPEGLKVFAFTFG